MDSPSPPPPAPARSFWQRRVVEPVIAQLTQGITPHKIALTIAVGSAFALFPVLGTTTLLCFLVALVLRLNQPITQLINQAFWPVHVPVIFACVRFGEWIFNVPHVSFNIRHMNRLLWDHPAQFFHEYGATAVQAIVAWAIFAPVFIALVYYTALPLMREIVRLKAAAAAKAAAGKSLEHPVP